MKIERKIDIPVQEDIDIVLKMGASDLRFVLRPKRKVDQKKLKEIADKLREEEKYPKRYAELSEMISVSNELVRTYSSAIEKSDDTGEIEELETKKRRELEQLKSMISERDEIADKVYNPEPIYEEQVKLFVVSGFADVAKYAKEFSWHETLYLIGSLLQEADEKK